ncbi:ABC transporter ATP-binding protein [Salinadaptatus halalkaliphilus]|uniref:ABC transporter ATP-binding protein n=1 Tax=Salinadaptatus halalkaliphilus TaxID=2419781 RepID=A0A4S3THE5_9EURY|nr:ABC transporter ATP-binding protein [Salinadaptatus halalkaliphilus]THE63341.1 ABC transporter ATP-binding protein [Salinadaptatus halalkaliphilus]
MVAIETNGLTKRYGDHAAIDGLDLTVNRGDVFGFVGPNGAGKSTTINILLDYVRPSDGSATVLGFDAQEQRRAVRERIGVLPDGYDLYDRLTGREHIRFAGNMNGVSVDEAQLLDRVGVSIDDAERPVGTYSTGMRQRLALGLTTIGDPELLLLDEPTSGLDPHGVALLQQLVREEADRGATVFFSSHVLDHVESVCNRVGILDDGRLVAMDTIEGLRDDADSGSTVEMAVEPMPDGIDEALATLEAVHAVDVTDSTITVSTTDSAAKPAVIDCVRDAGARVADVTTREATLEQVFDAYTTQPTDGRRTAAGRPPGGRRDR